MTSQAVFLSGVERALGWHSASLWKPFICCPSRNTLSPSCVRARRHRDGLAPGDGQAVGPLQLPQLLQLMYPAGPAAQCTLGRGAVLRGSQTKKKPNGGLCGTLPLPTTCCRTGFRWRIATFSAELWHFPKLTVTLDTGCGRCLSPRRHRSGILPGRPACVGVPSVRREAVLG